MSSDAVITVADVHKSFPIYRKEHHRLLQMLSSKRSKSRWFREFRALKGITFEVRRGESVGIVGRNGSGKSTLLQIVCGTLGASSGSVLVNGRIAALLELGAGFNPEFTGRENIYIYGTVLGLSRREVEDRLERIMEFADIGEFVDQPIKTYSSGMYVRLAFAVAINVEPDVLVIDEALAVGDARFQAKCFARLRELKEAGVSIVFVSHSTEQIVTHCDRAILIDGGQLLMEGAPKAVVNRYLDILFGAKRELPAIQEPQTIATRAGLDEDPFLRQPPEGSDPYSDRPNYNPHEFRWGDRAALLQDFRLEVGDENYPALIPNGSCVVLRLAIRFVRDVERPIIGVTIRNSEGVTVYATNTEMLSVGKMADCGRMGTSIRVDVEFLCRLGSGDYFISLGVASRAGDDVVPHDRRYDSIHFKVLADGFAGFSDLGAIICPAMVTV